MSYSARPVSVQLPEEDPSSGASLRAALRNVPMLPAPANVDDLLARLDGARDPLASRPLTAIVSDASVPDDEPVSPAFSEDDFFAPVAHAANANVPAAAPSPALRTLWSTVHAARTGLLAVILLIGSTVLPMRDAGPPAPVETASMPRSDAEATAQSAAASTVPNRPDPVAEPVAERAAEAAAAPSPQTAGEEPATEAASPDPQGGAQEPAPEASAAALQDEVEPVPAVGTSADGEVAVSDVEASEPEQEAGAASDEEPELPQETDQDLAQVESGDDTVAAAAPLPPARPKGLAAAPFAGAWAVSAKACTRAMQRRGHLVADIDSQRAKAGGTTCTFKTIKRQGDTWKTAAVCSNGRKTWKSDVRLTLERGRLTWKSQKGSTTYVRCHA
jgi:hypothetical protein